MFLNISNIPADVFELIFQFLRLVEIKCFSLTSREFFKYAIEYIHLLQGYNSKEQNNSIEGFKFWLNHARNPEYLIFDGRIMFSENKFKFDSLKKMDFDYVNWSNAKDINMLVIKSFPFFSRRAFDELSYVCNRIITLDLSYMPNLTSDSLEKIIKNNPNLIYLALEKSYNSVNDKTLNTISKSCKNLKTLSLAYCVLFTDTGLNYISSRCHLLREMSLAHCYEITSSAVCNLLKGCPSLRVLSLEWCLNIDKKTTDFISNLKQCNIEGIENCVNLSDQDISSAITNMRQLKFFSADNCHYIGHLSLRAIGGYLVNLKDLFINKCSKVDDEAIKYITCCCKKIENLGVEECNITDKGVIDISLNLVLLSVLGLNGNKITDNGVIPLIKNIPMIEKIYLSETYITNLSLITISEHLTNLKSLSLIGCNIDSIGLIKLGSKYSKCSTTLRDLHLSRYMELAYYFFHSHLEKNDSCTDIDSIHKNIRREIINNSKERETELVVRNASLTKLQLKQIKIDLWKLIFKGNNENVKCKLYFK